MLKLKKFAVLCTLTLGLFSSGANAADCGEVTITEMDWASAQVVTSVAKFLIETGYGCEITKVKT